MLELDTSKTIRSINLKYDQINTQGFQSEGGGEELAFTKFIKDNFVINSRIIYSK